MYMVHACNAQAGQSVISLLVYD